jgi:hypothetical protein
MSHKELLYQAITQVDNSVWISQAAMLFCSSLYFLHMANKIQHVQKKLDEVLKEIQNREQVKEEE